MRNAPLSFDAHASSTQAALCADANGYGYGHTGMFGFDRPDADEVDERHAECETALHVAVDEYVYLLRAAGNAPERALIHLKDVLRNAPAMDLDGADRAQMMERVVRWGIEAYDRPAHAGDARTPSPNANALVRAFLATLAEYGLHALLARLNARTRYRYTGLYRIEGPLLRNLALFDRENPELELGNDINALVDTCCDIVAETGRPFATVDTLRSSRRRPSRPLLIRPVVSGCAHLRFRRTCLGNVVPLRSSPPIDAGRRGRRLVVGRLLASDRGAGRLAPACSPSSPGTGNLLRAHARKRLSRHRSRRGR